MLPIGQNDGDIRVQLFWAARGMRRKGKRRPEIYQSHFNFKAMTSENKKNKLKRSGAWRGALKNRNVKLKRGLFFNASQRKLNNKKK
jgi:hypothetical protein